MHPHRLNMRTTLTFILPALAPCAVWADISVSANASSLNDSSGITTTLGALSNDTSTSTQTSNASILQANIDSLNAQISANQTTLSSMSSSNASYTELQGQITQLKATVVGLQGILDRIKQGYVVTDYTTSTDAATLGTTISIGFSKTAGSTTSTSTLTAYIPGVISVTDDSSSDTSSSSTTSSDSTDMLTTVLQQVGLQMLVGQSNPLSNIQSTLNNLTSTSGIPLSATAIKDAITKATGLTTPSCATDGTQAAGNGVAVYDISAGKVYMPDGSVLEAHSGMYGMKDNPAYANQRNNGPTPPNTYTLSMRESPYYGVEALRLTPSDPGSMYGRDGILAHSKLVGGNNGSHGCVAFADYQKFLDAYKRGQVKTLIVVPKKTDSTNICNATQVNTATPTATTTTTRSNAQ